MASKADFSMVAVTLVADATLVAADQAVADLASKTCSAVETVASRAGFSMVAVMLVADATLVAAVQAAADLASRTSSPVETVVVDLDSKTCWVAEIVVADFSVAMPRRAVVTRAVEASCLADWATSVVEMVLA